ncbi:T9SS type A sorting domain-containing protein [Joostella atrarenae]|uniref:T9SS type A sorting domain-containing protein n=1 Tax=Joostella atrarenae TaxID=679257 RepID=A0ABS9IYQ7_9FLAO|nr:T9SS type A sorting domain-containing protein [Joostella atrarenae]MCF8713316.1 T9SS type A sorting domain-containing protein [Joostella atrarenae]
MKRFLLSLFIALSSFYTFSQSVFINELHYDNAGSDVGESIEIAAPQGTDLSLYNIVLYNGSNGTVYNTVTINAVIADLSNGYGVAHITLPSNGIQNGSPDGIALVDVSNTVIQFLSYEGTFVASEGPASGMLSEDIGVAQSNSSTSEGASLALIGTGTDYSEFSWEAQDTSTFGGINTNQNFGVLEITPVINEFVFNHTGSDTNEYVEVFGKAETDLSLYWILEIEGDISSAGTIDGAFQLGTTNIEGYYTTPFFSNEFENGSLTLLLVENFTGSVGDQIDSDADGTIDNFPWETLIDAVAVKDNDNEDITYAETVLTPAFDGSTFTVGGASRIPNSIDSNAISDWVRNGFNGEGLPDYPDATSEDGEAINTPNSANKIFEDNDGGTDAIVLINEIDADTEGTDTAEFIELYDGGVGNSSLDGLTLVLYNGSNDLSYNAYDLDGYTTNANGYFVLGNEGVSNVSLVFGTNGLQNGADAVALYQADATDFPNGTEVETTNLIDAIVYDTNDSDDAELLVLLNDNQPQVNEDFNSNKDFHSLQRYANGSGGLRNTETYVAAIPTPGTSNTNALEQINLLINEIDVDTPGSDVAEFIELYDGGIGNIALDGFVLVLYNGNGDAVYNAFDLSGYVTNADGYFVLGNEGVANVSLVFGANGLQNGADAVALYQGSINDFQNGAVLTTSGLIDAVVYDTNDDDDVELLTLLNAGEPQLNEDLEGDKDNHSLQRIPNGSGGFLNTSSYVAKKPTPGVQNEGIVVVPTETIPIVEARALPDGTTVTITGVLTVADNFAGPAYLQDNTGGIAIFDEQIFGGNFAIGDSITVTASRSSFNNQIQLGNVSSVESNGVPNEPILPKDITLVELGDYRGQLVRITDATFPTPGDLLFGDSNTIITDASGTGELRIDGNVAGLSGLAQPETCSEIIGVVGTFNEFAQLLPRMKVDLACAEPFDPNNGIDIPKENTLDIVTWNIEWFGDEGNSPAAGNQNSDAIQKDSVVTILKKLNADIYTVVEISDDELFAQAVGELDGYDFILSDATSYPNDSGTKQKIGFIYKTATVTPKKTQALLKSIHPYYNGGDTSYLLDYPSEADRFYASGRLPFLMTADVNINGASEEINIVALHARANSSNGPQLRYDMRKYDMEVLKDSLDVMFPESNLILAGDYNDDLDETVADGINTTVSSFEAFINDPDEYFLATLSLSETGKRSYAFRENMIDHISLSNELEDNFIENSATVHYEFYDNDYTSTVSDHFAVSIRLSLDNIEPLVIENVIVNNISCAEADNGMASVEVSGGVAPYEYLWSNGEITQSVSDLIPGDYDVIVYDVNGKSVTEYFTITEPEGIEILMPEVDKIVTGYGETNCITLAAEMISGGEGEYSFHWNTEEITETISVCPEETTTYTLTVTDANGCSKSESITVIVEDVSCGNNPWIEKVAVCYRGRSLCVSKYAVPHLLNLGAVLGSCSDEVNETSIASVYLIPNPVRHAAALVVNSNSKTKLELQVYDLNGQLKQHEKNVKIKVGYNLKPINFSRLSRGIYILKVIENGHEVKDIRMVKR